MIAVHPRPVRTMTFDNGTEFHSYKALEATVDAQCYFATPHHAWERGTNENTSGLIRQYFKKRTSMAHLTQPNCQRVADNLNRRPRKPAGRLFVTSVSNRKNQVVFDRLTKIRVV